MSVIPDNPASRYHSILKKVRAGNVSLPIINSWADALGVEPSDRAGLAHRMAATATLLSDIHDHLVALPSEQYDPDTFRRHFFAWSKPLLASDLQTNKRNWSPHEIISEDALAALAALGYFLSERRVEPIIQETSIDGLLPRFEELISLATDADDLDPDMRAFLVRHLTNLAERLRFVRIYGRPGIDEATGRFMIEAAQIEREVAREPKSRLARLVRSEAYSAFRVLVDDLLKVVGVAAGVIAIGQGFGLFSQLPSAEQTSNESSNSE